VRCLGFMALCGCNQLFGLESVPDAANDAPTFDASLFQIGCADGTREGFSDLSRARRIAGCAGAWTIGGIKPAPGPACDRQAGNTGVNLLGTGCTASDLCASVWSICDDRLLVLSRIPDQTCTGITGDVAFFATQQSGLGSNECNATGTNDVFGCGTLGAVPAASCAPLDRVSGNDCSAINSAGGWMCLSPAEPANIIKLDPQVGGGALCCQNDPPGL